MPTLAISQLYRGMNFFSYLDTLYCFNDPQHFMSFKKINISIFFYQHFVWSWVLNGRKYYTFEGSFKPKGPNQKLGDFFIVLGPNKSWQFWYICDTKTF